MSKRWCTRNNSLASCAVILLAAAGVGVVNCLVFPAQQQQQQQQQSSWCRSSSSSRSRTGDDRQGGISSIELQQQQIIRPPRRLQRCSMELRMSDKDREDEIRQRIQQLKEDGKLKPKPKPQISPEEYAPSHLDTPLDKMRKETKRMKASTLGDEYADKLGSKLGGRKGRQVGRMLGIDVSVSSSVTKEKETEDEMKDVQEKEKERKPKLGALEVDDDELDEEYDEDDEEYEIETEEQRRERLEISTEGASDAIGMLRRNVDDVEENDESNEEEMDEEDMLDAVAKALARSGGMPSVTRFDVMAANEDYDDDDDEGTAATAESVTSSTASTGEKTSGIGGSWSPPSTEKEVPDSDYQPKVGTWGAFPRPRNISVAYGGGKRVGAGVTTDQTAKQASINSTKDRLKAYREKMGIVVQSEKDYVDVIEEALALASRAMQRGSYGAGVSALEKVTQYCSTKSKLGGKVFLELAMAYEAEGKTDQAIGLYAALSKSPIEKIKNNADRLLYGLEAMNFMRNEAKLKEFSRKNAAETFIDATGFSDMSKNFDKVYNTAYIDLDKGSQYYRMLTENVVRSTREARQILLKATSSKEVERIKVVQALRSISRHFDDALTEEKKNEEAKNVPVDYAGRPIVSTRRSTQDDLATAIGMDGFVLSTAEQTLTGLNGEWRLQLMADKKGDGVDFFNSTLLWQAYDTNAMEFEGGTKGLRSSSQSGDLDFNGKERILSRMNVSTKNGNLGGGLLSMLMGGGGGDTARERVKGPQQIMLIDSALIVTKAIVKASAVDNVKDYYSVWRRVEPGTYSSEA